MWKCKARGLYWANCPSGRHLGPYCLGERWPGEELEIAECCQVYREPDKDEVYQRWLKRHG